MSFPAFECPLCGETFTGNACDFCGLDRGYNADSGSEEWLLLERRTRLYIYALDTESIGAYIDAFNADTRRTRRYYMALLTRENRRRESAYSTAHAAQTGE